MTDVYRRRQALKDLAEGAGAEATKDLSVVNRAYKEAKKLEESLRTSFKDEGISNESIRAYYWLRQAIFFIAQADLPTRVKILEDIDAKLKSLYLAANCDGYNRLLDQQKKAGFFGRE